MSKWELLVAAAFWLTCLATLATAVLLLGVWREVRLVLQLLNGACL